MEDHRKLYRTVSENYLRMLHDAMHRALKEDDEAVGEKKYGVREYPDFREQSDQLEETMTDRGIPFVPVPW